MSCTSSLIAVAVAPGAQAYIAVAVAQVGAHTIIAFSVISSWHVRLAAQRESHVDFAVQTPARHDGAWYILKGELLLCRLTAHGDWL